MKSFAALVLALVFAISLLALTGAQVACPTAGTVTRVTATPLRCIAYNIFALPGNTGSIYVGGPAVSSTSYAIRLSAGDNYAWTPAGSTSVYDLSVIYFTSSINGEGISYGCQ
jgi:hypothetical protein